MKISRLAVYLQLSSLVFGVGMAIYEWIAFSGIHAWFAEIDANSSDRYSLLPAIGFSIVGWGAPLIILIELLKWVKVIPKTHTQIEFEGELKEITDRGFTLDERLQRKKKFRKRLTLWGVIGLLTTQGIALYGYFEYLDAVENAPFKIDTAIKIISPVSYGIGGFVFGIGLTIATIKYFNTKPEGRHQIV